MGAGLSQELGRPWSLRAGSFRRLVTVIMMVMYKTPGGLLYISSTCLRTVVVSNKLPQMWWLNTTENYSLIVLLVRSIKSVLPGPSGKQRARSFQSLALLGRRSLHEASRRGVFRLPGSFLQLPTPKGQSLP